MKDAVKEILKRTDINQLRSFLLHGVDDFEEMTSMSMSEKLNESSKAIYERLEKIYPNEDELDKAVGDLSDALVMREKVYTEIGMKAGSRILYQLLVE